MEVDTMMAFKILLDRYMDGKGLEGYQPNAGKWDKPRMSTLSA